MEKRKEEMKKWKGERDEIEGKGGKRRKRRKEKKKERNLANRRCT